MPRTGFFLVTVLLPALFASGPVADELPTGTLIPGVACRNDPTQTYTLYLPGGYTDQRRWPVLYVFDPRGRSEMAAEIFREAAETYDQPGNYVLGANIAGFVKVADAMLDQGVV